MDGWAYGCYNFELDLMVFVCTPKRGKMVMLKTGKQLKVSKKAPGWECNVSEFRSRILRTRQKNFSLTKKFAGIVWKPYKAGREREQLHAIAQNHSTIILRNKSPHTNINLSVKYVKIYILHEVIPTL